MPPPIAPPPPSDRRQRAASFRVVVRIPSADRFRALYLEDVAAGGLFVRAERALPAGAAVTLELWPPGWDHALDIEGQVVRSLDAAAAAAEGRSPGMAIRFVNVAPSVSRQLEALVAEHRSAPATGTETTGASAASASIEAAAAREKAARLEVELAEARGQVEALSQRVHVLEARDAESGPIVAECDDLRRRLAEAVGRVESEQVRAKEQLEVVTREFEALTRKLAREREETRLQRERGDRLALELKKSEAREIGLRGLLARVSGAEEAAAGPSAPERAIADAGEREAGPAGIELAAMGPAPDLELDLDLDEIIVEDEDEDLLAPVEIVAEPKGAADRPPLAPAGPREVPEEELEAFNTALLPRTRLVAGEHLRGHSPLGSDEAQVIELLDASPTLETLVGQLTGRVSEGEIRRILCLLYSGGLVDLRP